MRKQILNIAQRPLFLILLPLFFFLHGLVENYSPLLIKDAIILFLNYSAASLLLTGIFWFFPYKNISKAALTAFILMSCNFFFGSVYDFIKKNLGDSFLTKFSLLLPAIAVVITLLIILIKNSKRRYLRLGMYLNLALILLILIDAFSLSIRINEKDPAQSFHIPLAKCDTCSKPDIYLIIADEYAGHNELKELFSFNNFAFENELHKRGFHITNNSVSNYNATVYSMASMMNMNYLNGLEPVVNHRDMLLCRYLIKKNYFTSYLQKNGYEFYNYSFFDIADKKKAVRNIFFPTNKSLLTFQTLINRLKYTFGARFASGKKIIDIKKSKLYINSIVDSLCRNIALQKTPVPKFVYTHLDIPHHPYFFDSTGKEIPIEKLTDEFKMNKKAYIEYLIYSNNRILSLIDHIRKNSTSPPVIILLSDHGFRQLPPEISKDYYFMNLNAVYFPSGNYSKFYDGMSTVNSFRVILNSLFNQQLSLLKDSTIFITE